MAPRADNRLDGWLRSVVPRAVAYARTLLPRPDAAEDVVQGVICRLLAHKEYDLLQDGEKLMFRSITNACINRSSRGRDTLSLDYRESEGSSLYEVVPNAEAADPAEEVGSRQLLDTVGAELRRLPKMQRAAVELKAMGHTLSDIAEMLAVSSQNAGVLVHRGRTRLRERMGERLPGGLR